MQMWLKQPIYPKIKMTPSAGPNPWETLFIFSITKIATITVTIIVTIPAIIPVQERMMMLII